MNMTQPFNEDGFNFTKIRQNETVAEMVFTEDLENGKCDNEGQKQNLLVINVSPLEYCHYLFVPDVFSKWTQVSRVRVPSLIRRLCDGR